MAVSEELNCISNHIKEIYSTLNKPKNEIGQNLVFFMQTLTKEIHTLISKLIASEITINSFEIKTLIEQIQEQI
ncbi:DUF1732 domain-containing protein [Buchnera aphidicola (Hormaphis cornu)]|nr:DUF1732 domain-containing protein [Buchnera aphidicola (Hormaphis cornu)]